MELKKGHFYALPHHGGFSFGTYCGLHNGRAVFRASDFVDDGGELNGSVPLGVEDGVVEIWPNSIVTHAEVYRQLMNKLA